MGKPRTQRMWFTQEIMENTKMISTERLTHLKQLEAESIHIIREVVAEFDNPVMMYSVGKDSAVMLHLALKAFAPAKLPFPLLHVDTLWKFKESRIFHARHTASRNTTNAKLTLRS